MKIKNYFVMFAAAAMVAMSAGAQTVKIKGVLSNNRTDDGGNLESQYVGYNYELQKPIFVVDQGLYSMNWDGTTLSAPVKDPAVNISDFYSNGTFTDNAKAEWAANFNKMWGNSGAVYLNGQLWTIMSRDYQSTEPEEMFAVRQWDANTGDLLKEYPYMSEDQILESAGLAYNPKDGKVYGLFYVTNAQLNEAITSDPEYFQDEDDQYEGREGLDAGYAIGTIDMNTMEVKLITKGLYYYNFITFAINEEGRAFALTSGGSMAALGDNGKYTDVNGDLTGAQLYEFNLETGNLYLNQVEKIDSEGETYIAYEPIVPATGYMSKYKRQAACFAKSNPNKMYWVGHFNSGKGINDYGSWGELSDKEWRTNGKYDTCLYEIDVNTGEANRLAMIKDRMLFSALWIDGDNSSDGEYSGIEEVATENGMSNAANGWYTIDGRMLNGEPTTSGMFIHKNGAETQKVVLK